MGTVRRYEEVAAVISDDTFCRERFETAVEWAVVLTGDPHAAQDIAQSVLARVTARLSSIENPDAYLRRAVVNACRNWRRTEVRRRRREVRAAEVDRHFSTDLGPASLPDLDLDVLDALNSLRFRERAALVLRYWAGWSDRDIAETLRCSESTVRVLVFRGLRHLRVALRRSE